MTDASRTDTVLSHPGNVEPNVFTRDELGWLPWLLPLEEAAFTDRHWAGLVDAGRAKSPYFALLVRDPDVLGARTRTDKDIFYNSNGGLPRAERELAAAAVSRLNGCIYCASVHARFAAHHSKQPDKIQAILDGGVETRTEPVWDAVTDAAVALTRTPSDFGPAHVDALRAAGLEDDAIVDTIFASAFFNWANRLMLSLGEPVAARA